MRHGNSTAFHGNQQLDQEQGEKKGKPCIKPLTDSGLISWVDTQPSAKRPQDPGTQDEGYYNEPFLNIAFDLPEFPDPTQAPEWGFDSIIAMPKP